MNPLRETIKQVAPEPLLDIARGVRDALQRSLLYPSSVLHPWRRTSIQRLGSLKDAHRGDRCFIIGNGPSLKKTDLSRLKDARTFGMNRIYLLFPELGFTTTYLVSVNSLVIEQCAGEIQRLSIPKFLSWRSRDLIYPPGNGKPDKYTTFLHTTFTGPKFATDARRRIWEGATVTYVALQLAYHMGFQEVILIGVDHSFTTKGKANRTVVSQGDDPNHFHAQYFGKGFRWQLPDLETSEIAYRMARRAYEADDRRVFDATIGGELTVFPKIPYDSLF